MVRIDERAGLFALAVIAVVILATISTEFDSEVPLDPSVGDPRCRCAVESSRSTTDGAMLVLRDVDGNSASAYVAGTGPTPGSIVMIEGRWSEDADIVFVDEWEIV